jgi:hypothetical protein
MRAAMTFSFVRTESAQIRSPARLAGRRRDRRTEILPRIEQHRQVSWRIVAEKRDGKSEPTEGVRVEAVQCADLAGDCPAGRQEPGGMP